MDIKKLDLEVIFNEDKNPVIQGLSKECFIGLYINCKNKQEKNEYRAIIFPSNILMINGKDLDLSEAGAIMIIAIEDEKTEIRDIMSGRNFAQGGLLATAGERVIVIMQNGNTCFETGPAGRVSMFSNALTQN